MVDEWIPNGCPLLMGSVAPSNLNGVRGFGFDDGGWSIIAGFLQMIDDRISNGCPLLMGSVAPSNSNGVRVRGESLLGIKWSQWYSIDHDDPVTVKFKIAVTFGFVAFFKPIVSLGNPNN
eukprot:Gb_10886 [translate_table: standard]